MSNAINKGFFATERRVDMYRKSFELLMNVALDMAGSISDKSLILFLNSSNLWPDVTAVSMLCCLTDQNEAVAKLTLFRLKAFIVLTEKTVPTLPVEIRIWLEE